MASESEAADVTDASFALAFNVQGTATRPTRCIRPAQSGVRLLLTNLLLLRASSLRDGWRPQCYLNRNLLATA